MKYVFFKKHSPITDSIQIDHLFKEVGGRGKSFEAIVGEICTRVEYKGMNFVISTDTFLEYCEPYQEPEELDQAFVFKRLLEVLNLSLDDARFLISSEAQDREQINDLISKYKSRYGKDFK